MSLRDVLRRRVKLLAERLTHTYIYRILPRGMELPLDIATVLPGYKCEVIFDVGANVGQSGEVYLARFPQARVYCFEPVLETFRQLQSRLGSHSRVECLQLAFGPSEGGGTMILADSSQRFFLARESREIPEGVGSEPVKVTTLDAYCGQRGIKTISLLKIDTEGGDLDVLKGAAGMLAAQRVDLVQVEAALNPGNTWHVPLEALKGYLESHRYFLFGIYEQVGEWPTHSPHLRRANPVFLSTRMIERYRRSPRPSA